MAQLNILFIGDIVGHVGLRKVIQVLPQLIQQYGSHCVIVNGENIVDGKGLSEKEANELFANGVHCITTGNHVWENWKARTLLSTNPHVLRPHNYPIENPGKGFTLITLPDQRTVGVVQVQGRAYMQPIDDPFKSVDGALAKLKPQTSVLFVDFHADASAEKIAMGWYLDGKVSAVCGTHTHTQTNDASILPNGTAFISDVGMSGPYDSVIGMKKDIALKRMMLQTAHKYETAESDVRVCGAHISVDEATGMALEIDPFMIPAPRRTNR
jgi:2',3'-cyclic-nucleotide 2'-phosphodiesterase